MAKPLIAAGRRADEDLVRLRDEIAMHALNGMIISGSWGVTSVDGTFTKNKGYRDYSAAAYRFADEMLRAREER